MLRREEILGELWRRIYSIPGIRRAVRNPDSAPNLSDLPSVGIIEHGDSVISRTKRNDVVAHKRKLRIALEVFVNGATEESATQELLSFVYEVKKAVYAGGASLGDRCEITEVDATQVVSVAGGEHIRAIGLGFDIYYAEHIAL